MHKQFRLILLLAGVLLFTQGFGGYTSKTNLPEHIESVHVDKVSNTIDIASEVSSQHAYRIYRPGLEVQLRNALIERFIFDGHLRIASKDSADAILSADLLSFDRDPVRYNADDSIQEFRIHVTARISFNDALSGEPLWEAASISGQSSYFLSGTEAKSEDEAVLLALEDLVRHTVEDILEVW